MSTANQNSSFFNETKPKKILNWKP